MPQFFGALARFELHRFAPKTLLANGHVVVALIDAELTVKATGRRLVAEDEVHIWHFDAHSRVTRFTHTVDTHPHRITCGLDRADESTAAAKIP